MSASPTPGPWTYGTRKDGTIWVSLGDYTTGQHFQFDWMAGEANARLIAAAPDLLAACKRLLECMEEDEPHEVLCIATTAACDAIAKAEGRA